MGKKVKAQSDLVEDLALSAARKANERLMAEEQNEVNARAKKLEAPPSHST